MTHTEQAPLNKSRQPLASNPRISVIMATHNRADYLDRSINSILEQSFTDFEFIIVNDGSSDNTAEALSDYERRDGRIRVITQENQGLAASRNNGAKTARGEYLAFMDDDDASGVYRLEVQLEALQRHPGYEACGLYSENIGMYQREKEKKPAKEKVKRFFNNSPAYEINLTGILGPNTFVSRQSFLAAGGYRTQPTIIEDMDFTLRYSRKYKWLWLERAPLYFYSYGNSGGGSRLTTEAPKRFIKRHIACYVSEWCRHQGLPDPVEEDKTLADILRLAPSLSQEAKKTIYETMHHLLHYSFAFDHYALRVLDYKRKPNKRFSIEDVRPFLPNLAKGVILKRLLCLFIRPF